MNDLFIRKIEISWERIDDDSYLRQIPSLSGTDEITFHSPVTFFTGENGSGKSTLLEALAVSAGFNPEGGSKNYSFSTYDSHSDLYRAVRLIRSPYREDWGYFLRAESFYNVATMEEEYAKNGTRPSKGYHLMSHGESFLENAKDSFENRGLFFLDEPEAALSQSRQLSLMALIFDAVRCGSQFFIVTHSPILLGYPDAEILCFDDGPVHPVRYEETDSYRLTKMFLNQREQVLRNLFEDE